jgi:hypothetical protein
MTFLAMPNSHGRISSARCGRFGHRFQATKNASLTIASTSRALDRFATNLQISAKFPVNAKLNSARASSGFCGERRFITNHMSYLTNVVTPHKQNVDPGSSITSQPRCHPPAPRCTAPPNATPMPPHRHYGRPNPEGNRQGDGNLSYAFYQTRRRGDTLPGWQMVQ